MNEGTLTIAIAGLPEPLAFEDWVHDVLFTTVSIATGQSVQITSFRALPNIGGTTSATGPRETNTANLVTSGQFAKGGEMWILSLQFLPREMYGTALSTTNTNLIAVNYGATAQLGNRLGELVELFSKATAELVIGRKTFAEGPLYNFPAGKGLWGSFGGVTQNNSGSYVVQNGVPDPRAKVGFLIAHHIQEQINFDVTTKFASALATLGAALTAEWHAEGTIRRPVQ